MRQLVAYFLTFSCYGSHLHGDAPYSVDRRHNVVDGPYLAELPGYRRASLGAMEQGPYELDEQRRCMVLEAIRNVCQYRGWQLLAIHVRVAHVHVVVQAIDASPEAVMTQLKAYASRGLNLAGIDPPDRKRWTRHGSTRYLWTQKDLADVLRYVVSEQGEPMALWVADEVTVFP